MVLIKKTMENHKTQMTREYIIKLVSEMQESNLNSETKAFYLGLLANYLFKNVEIIDK